VSESANVKLNRLEETSPLGEFDLKGFGKIFFALFSVVFALSHAIAELFVAIFEGELGDAFGDHAVVLLFHDVRERHIEAELSRER